MPPARISSCRCCTPRCRARLRSRKPRAGDADAFLKSDFSSIIQEATMALVLKNKDGIWYWDDGNPLDATLPAALYGAGDGIFLPTDPISPPIADVVCPRSITFAIPGK